MTINTPIKPWMRLEGKVSLIVLTAPKTCGDPKNKGDWPEVEEFVVNYLERNIVGKPWADHLTLVAAVMTARRLQANTIQATIQQINVFLDKVFRTQNISSIEKWDVTGTFQAYLKAEICPSDSLHKRSKSWSRYSSAVSHVNTWLKSLPVTEQDMYRQFLLPAPDKNEFYGVKKIGLEVKKQAKRARKIATDAVVPSLPLIRAKVQLRFNRMARIRQAYDDALKEFQCGKPYTLPFAFSYEEGEDKEKNIPPQERLHFRIWDRHSYVLAHKDQYSVYSISALQKQTGAYSDKSNHFFLEFVKAERLVKDALAEGVWFKDLLKPNLLGHTRFGTDEEIQTKQSYLRAWGYGDNEKSDEIIEPFKTGIAGLLNWSKEEGKFMIDAQERAEGVLVPVEPLYAAAMFGLLAIDIFTTTGMRINEAMQIRPTRDCLVRLVMDAPPEAKNQSPKVRYCLRLIPKGERANKPHDYFIGNEQLRLMAMTGKMLSEHYGLKPGEQLPEVAFCSINARAFRFKQKQPYLFQYNNCHLSAKAITACMKFLLHGMTFKDKEGKNVIVTAHLLRHAFATHVVQVLKIPVDIVGGWLQQKNLDVTEYYNAPTDTMLAEHHDQLLMRFSANINVGKAVIRSPEELQRAYDEAKGKVGTLAQVEGGLCVSHGFCAAKFACIGCAGKVVDPEKRYQVEHKKKWAQMQLEYAKTEGLYPEAERMKQLIRDCDNEMVEMDLIEAYRRDGQRGVSIQVEGNE